jgi:DNA-binding NarL/FixJ family response regulator
MQQTAPPRNEPLPPAPRNPRPSRHRASDAIVPKARRSLRLLLVEQSDADEARVRQELDRQGVGFLVERCELTEGFATALRSFGPDVVLVDQPSESRDVKAALRVVQSVHPTTAVILYTDTLDGAMAVSSIRAGAEDIVLKDSSHLLPTAIESALAIRKKLTTLSPRQLEVLRLVAEGHSTRAIGERLGLSVKTIETHRGELMKRLGIHDVVGLVRYAVRVGIVPQVA